MLALYLACNKNADDTAIVADPPAWDEEAPDIACAWPDGEAGLRDEALSAVGLTAAQVGWDDDQWRDASYRSYLDDDFLLPWFRALHWEPLRLPCHGGQLAADLDHAGATDHPVATALGHAMDLLESERRLEPIDPAVASQRVVELDGLPEDLATALVPILEAMERVHEAREESLDAAPAGARNLVDKGHGGALLDTSTTYPRFTQDEDLAWVLDPGVGPRALHDRARVLAYAIEAADLGRFEGTDATLDFDSYIGRILIAGPGSDAPGELEDVALYLDLGGDDTYAHGAGANSKDVGVSVHIDLGGDDSYGYVATDDGTDALLPSDADGRYGGDDYYGQLSFSDIGRQGSGRMGVGLLFDLGGGADSYTSLRVSQGWGHLGVGVLYDDGGDDLYRAESGAQGSASMGIGLLLDAGGNDTYETFHASQGFAYVQAVGIALDLGGDDTWYANPGKDEDGGTTLYYSPQLPGNGNSSFVQGVGFGRRGDSDLAFLSGGVGVLRDVGGDDSYQAGTFAQGSGYWQGLGYLLDGAGSDLYDAYYYVQGGAAHYAIGVLLDGGEGGDAFNTRQSTNYMEVGAGHDFSVGMLVNDAGDDTYVYGGLATGASNCQGIGVFVDNAGSDTYTAGSTYSTGLGNHSSECESRDGANSIGLFLDAGGSDTYDWPEDETGRTAPGDDTSFGWSWNQTADEYGAAVDGEGATGIYATGVAP